MNVRLLLPVLAAGAATALLIACWSTAPRRVPDAIYVAGEPVPAGMPIVHWDEEPFYSAYERRKRFDADAEPDGKPRHSHRNVDNTPDALAAHVRMFVLHFDQAGTSRQCFKILQDVRNLSVHFLLDLDGTVYQTIDLQERAWHATVANDASVGVEIAHPGHWPQPLNADMRRWYEQDEQGWRIKFPGFLGDPAQRTPGFVARPARPDFVSGEVQGRVWHQFDYTAEQYRSLPRLLAAVARAFPRVKLDVPRNADGSVRNHVLSEAELAGYEGVLGHYHVQKNKSDPGPALQWDRILQEARELLAASPGVQNTQDDPNAQNTPRTSR